MKQATETLANHPKVSLAVTAAFTSNVWLDYGLPIIQGVTTIAGMFVVVCLAIKHFIDLKNQWQGRDSVKEAIKDK